MERLLDLMDHQRGEIGGIRLEAHAAREREQDLARIVLLAKEALVEPLPRAIAIAQPRDARREQCEIDDGTARNDLAQILLE